MSDELNPYIERLLNTGCITGMQLARGQIQALLNQTDAAPLRPEHRKIFMLALSLAVDTLLKAETNAIKAGSQPVPGIERILKNNFAKQTAMMDQEFENIRSEIKELRGL